MMIKNKKILTLTLVFITGFVGVGQTLSGPPPPAPPPPPGLNIDMGIYILLAVGLLYGIFKAVRSKA